MWSPPHGRWRPAEREEANRRRRETGKPRSASTERITPPTCPVAPTIPMSMTFRLRGCLAELEGGVQFLHGPLHVPGPHDAADADRRRRDHLAVDAALRQH